MRSSTFAALLGRIAGAALLTVCAVTSSQAATNAYLSAAGEPWDDPMIGPHIVMRVELSVG